MWHQFQVALFNLQLRKLIGAERGKCRKSMQMEIHRRTGSLTLDPTISRFCP